jgi:AsmA family/AsmA-like C-terminal region
LRKFSRNCGAGPLDKIHVNKIKKWWKLALALLLVLIALQVGASFVVRTAPIKVFLTRQLEKSFGRPVEVRQFSASLFPTPQLDSYGISVGEDPSFGREYFLRAEQLSAGLRWLGLLGGHFELGTLRLDRPSLSLARNSEGRWNLERWLPAATSAVGKLASPPASARSAPPTRRLQKIDISDGRVDFKVGDDKISFAFIQVEGTVEQVAEGRWRLDLEAQPWRSGVPLQLAGTVRVQGDVAGTSTRLQPAHLQASWERSSLADVFRLMGGRDFGVRGTFSGELTADSGAREPDKDVAGDWTISMQARATGLHRWDLTERDDNPRIGVRIKGLWNPGLGITNAREIVVETPRSNLRGTALLKNLEESSFQVHLDSSGIQAADFLDWYRAFQPDVGEAITAAQYFTGTAAAHGWPLVLDEAAFSTLGGRWIVPGFARPFDVRPMRGGTQRGNLAIEPFAVRVPLFVAAKGAGRAGSEASSKAVEAGSIDGTVNVSLLSDLRHRSGSLHFEGQVPQAESIFALASAFGRNLQHGWKLNGKASGDLRWEWNSAGPPEWSGHTELSHATLQVAGLNQPLQLESLRTEWINAQRKFTLGKVSAVGTTWNGSVEQTGSTADEEGEIPIWKFQLQADHLDTAELDRWMGPRARPNWLQRLLPSALGGSSPPPPSSAVLKRIRAQGDLGVDDVSIEKIKLRDFHAHVGLAGLKLTMENAQAQWSGGTAQGSVVAMLSSSPTYEVAASFVRVSLTQTPWLMQLADHVAGTAEGSLELRTAGIGREVLIKNLTGKGQLLLNKIELRGWDLPGTMAQGEWKTGVSRWAFGSGTFHIGDGEFELNALRLASNSDEFLLKGSVSFSEDADLTAESHVTGRTARQPTAIRFLTISGPLTGPRVSLEKATAQQPGD